MCSDGQDEVKRGGSEDEHDDIIDLTSDVEEDGMDKKCALDELSGK